MLRHIDLPPHTHTPTELAGNKFGEPLICGFTRSYAHRTAGGERREWIKPILFTGGFGQMDARHRKKSTPEVILVSCGLRIGGWGSVGLIVLHSPQIQIWSAACRGGCATLQGEQVEQVEQAEIK